MNVTRVSAKTLAERVRLTIDWRYILSSGESVSSAVVNIYHAGGEPAPELVAVGSPTIASKSTGQLVSGGSAGSTYTIVFTMTTDTGQIFEEALSIRVTE